LIEEIRGNKKFFERNEQQNKEEDSIASENGQTQEIHSTIVKIDNEEFDPGSG